MNENQYNYNVDFENRMSMKNVGTVLKDNSQVLSQSNEIYTEDNYQLIQDIKKSGRSIPDTFLGNIEWNEYLSSIDWQGYVSNDWAEALCDAIADRFSLRTYDDIDNSTDLSSLELIFYKELFLNKLKVEDVDSQKNLKKDLFTGLSIYDCAKIIYEKGLTTKECFNKNDLLKFQDIDTKDIVLNNSVDKIKNIYDIEGKDQTNCINRNVARPLYTIRGIINLKNDPETIKAEIYKNGPVVTGFVVYDDFLNDFSPSKDDIYMGPKSDSKPVGGHAVRVVGWGKLDKYERDNKYGEEVNYWLCANSWGLKWGRYGGFFKIKMGVCGINDNFVAPIIDLGKIQTFYDYSKIKIPKNWTKHDKKTNIQFFYTNEVMDLIKQGKIKGEIISPVIRPYTEYPSYPNFFAYEVTNFQYRKRLNQKDYMKIEIDLYISIILFLLGICVALVIIILKLKKYKM